MTVPSPGVVISENRKERITMIIIGTIVISLLAVVVLDTVASLQVK